MIWFWQAFAAMLLLVVVPFLASAMWKNYGILPEITSLWWMISTGIGIGLWSFYKGYSNVMFSLKPILIVGGIGITLGALANILLFKAFGDAPNPGIPMAIVACNSVIAVIFTKFLSEMMPGYFSHLSFSWPELLGALLVVSGITVFKVWG